jgi:hypothetical protein
MPFCKPGACAQWLCRGTSVRACFDSPRRTRRKLRRAVPGTAALSPPALRGVRPPPSARHTRDATGGSGESATGGTREPHAGSAGLAQPPGHKRRRAGTSGPDRLCGLAPSRLPRAGPGARSGRVPRVADWQDARGCAGPHVPAALTWSCSPWLHVAAGLSVGPSAPRRRSAGKEAAHSGGGGGPMSLRPRRVPASHPTPPHPRAFL